MALLLKRQGITRVRPLLGGFDAWRERGYPLQQKPVGIEAIGDAAPQSQQA